MSLDLKSRVDSGPMTSFQYLAIAVCIVLNMIDGFDVLVMAFTAASVSAEWSLSGAQIGLLLSAGLFGMAAGSLFIAPWADRFGRRPLILLLPRAFRARHAALGPEPDLPGKLALLRGCHRPGHRRHPGQQQRDCQRVRQQALAQPGGQPAIHRPMPWARPSAACWRCGLLTPGAGARCSVWRRGDLADHVHWCCCGCRNPWTFCSPAARPTPWTGSIAWPGAWDNRRWRKCRRRCCRTPGRCERVSDQLLAPAMRHTTLLIWLLLFPGDVRLLLRHELDPETAGCRRLVGAQGITGGVLLNVGGIFGAALIGRPGLTLAADPGIVAVHGDQLPVAGAVRWLRLADCRGPGARLADRPVRPTAASPGSMRCRPWSMTPRSAPPGSAGASVSGASARFSRRPWPASCSMAAGNHCICMEFLPASS